MEKKAAAVLTIILFAILGSVYAQAPAQPTLPQQTVDLTMPQQGTSACPTLTSGSNCVRKVPAGDATNFQNAINAATCGDTIVLVAGSTYSGNFAIPQTSCTNNSGWIEIQSSAMSSLPSPGNRVTPTEASSYMPVISTPNTGAAFCFYPSSNHWRLMGLDITTSAPSPDEVYSLVILGTQSDCGTNLTVQSQLPNQIIFDRDYLYGTSGGINGSSLVVDRAILMNTQAFAIVDSYCDGIVDSAFDSQCVASSGNGAGPYLIQNNFLQAASENIMFGGSDPAIANIIPSDITIVGNLFSKTMTWFKNPSTYNVKNLFEIKNAQRVLLDGNVMQYDSNGPQHAAILIRSVNQSGGCTWCSALDVTITHNLVQHIPTGISIVPWVGGAGYASVPTGRVLVKNNLLLDIQCAYGSGFGLSFQLANSSASEGMHDITLDHNTTFNDPSACSVSGMLYLSGAGSGYYINNFQLTNNTANYGFDGISGDSCGNGSTSATCTLSNMSGTVIYNENAFLSSTGTPVWTTPATTLWTTLAGFDFTSISGTNPNLTGNFQLTSSSPGYRAGTDGQDIGVWDWICLNNDSAAALAGTFTPSPGCSMPGNLVIQPPTNLTATID